ncbi:hypothetical protein PV327_011455 [Microctonus hyperodae]|uniref:Uncharacterized protein n=1 Tax=Microctonus hyperodae TaxID=165561 RepID=A0AA39FHX5_MICHY|nr:hypothetical protein PV327_011455 [Microctonus hyperodae]
MNPEKDRQLQHVLQQPGVNILDRFMIDRELFISWADDIQKLFPVFKKRKINTSGTLYEHYGYLKGKLRCQHLLEPEQLVEAAPELLRLTEQEKDAVEWLAINVGPPDAVK